MNRFREFTITSAIVLAVYATSLIVAFAHLDQYRFFREDFGDPTFREHCYNDTQNGWIRTLGRPLAAKLECVVFFHTFKIRDFTYFRIICALGLGILAGIFSLWLQGKLVKACNARLLAAGLVAIPGAQNAVFMSNMPNTLTALLCICAGILSLRPWALRSHVGSFILLGVAFFLYTPIVTIFFIPLVFSLVLKQDERVLLKDFGKPLLIFAAAGAVFAKFGRKKFLDSSSGIPSAYQLHLSPEFLIANTRRFFNEILPLQMKAWDVYSELYGPYLLLLGIFVLIIVNRKRWLTSFAVFSLFFGVNVLYLFTHNVPILFRVMWPGTMAIIGVAILPLISSRSRWLSSVGQLGLIAGLTLAFWNNHRNVMNSAHEFSIVKEALKSAPSETKRVHIISVSSPVGLNGLEWVSSDEYNMPSTGLWLAFVPDIIRLAYIELNQTKVVLPTDLPAQLELFTEVEVKPTTKSDEYQLYAGNTPAGILRNDGRVKLKPWEARGEIEENGRILNMHRLGKWTRINHPDDKSLVGRYRIENRDPVVYVSTSKAGEPIPVKAFVIDMNSKVNRLR